MTFVSTNLSTSNGYAARPRRIAYVLKRYPRFSETFVVNEILAHEAAGLEIDIFALRPTSDTHFQHAIADVRAPVTHLRYGGIKAETLWNELSAQGQAQPECWNHLAQAEGYTAVEVYQAVLLAGEVRARGIEHIHAHFATTAAAVARLGALLSGVPYSITAHAKDIFHESIDPSLLARKLADASAVVTVSDYNVDYLRRSFPASATHIHRVYNGLKLDDYEFVEPTDRRPLILSVGRLVEKKGFADLIDACAVLNDTGIDFHCLIVGGGDLAESLESRIRRHDLADRVRMIGPRPRAEVLQLMRQAALLVAPCVTASTGDRDGLPTVLLEAMACGTPCLSTDLVGIPEVVRHRETGIVVPEHDIESLAAAMQRLLVDPRVRRRLALAARKLMEREFDIRRNAAHLRRLFAAGHGASARPALAEVG